MRFSLTTTSPAPCLTSLFVSPSSSALASIAAFPSASFTLLDTPVPLSISKSGSSSKLTLYSQ
ncbi:unnamed protein product, partial [Eruca vesicaria subsp. sativa]|nr:unnamed protein product [Eruca vesicaria subsp. sativa]